MKRLLLASLCVLFISGIVSADTFGSGANQFDIDFVNISGDSGDLGSWSAGTNYTFSGVNHDDYRIGTYEITNNQYAKFASNNTHFPDETVPANNITWFEAAEFVNYLNTSTGNQAAYKFTADVMGVWQDGDDGYDASNPFRNSKAKYFLPTEDEWVKAAYWNGMSLQTYATKDGSIPTSGLDTNYDIRFGEPWDVGSGSEELNGTFDMMGNVWEWTESSYYRGEYLPTSFRNIRNGSYSTNSLSLSSSYRDNYLGPINEYYHIGFRVASVIPEPCSLALLGLGGILLRRRKA